MEATFQRTNWSQQLTRSTKLDENELCTPCERNRNSALSMARPAGQQGDRQMAKGSCLDDKGRKKKMQEKTRPLSSKSWGTPSAARHFPAGEGSSRGTRGQEEAFSPGHPACYQETCWGGCRLGRMPEKGDTGCGAQVPADARACPKELDVSKQKTIQTLQQAGFPWQPMAPTLPPPHPQSPNSAAPQPFSSWTKLSIGSLWVKCRLDKRCWEGDGYQKGC